MIRMIKCFFKLHVVLFALTAVIGCTTQENEWHFLEITDQAGLGEFKHINGADGRWYLPETIGAGGAFFDFNNDNLIDIALVGGKTWDDRPSRGIWLFKGDGHGYFTDVTDEMRLSQIHAYGMGLIAGDVDNDGDQDLFLSALESNFLLINDGDQFRDYTFEAGLDTTSEWNVGAIFFDANRDGWLDLYVTGYVNWTPETDLFCTRDGTQKRYCTPELYTGTSGRFYLNQGDGTFIEETQNSGLLDSGKTLGIITVDINQDQWPDIVLANDTEPDLLFLNNGDGTYEEVGLSMGMALDSRGRARAGMGIDVGVVDSTGEPTLFIGHFENQMNGVFRHTSEGFFEDRGANSGIGSISFPVLTFGMLLLDGDLDGDLDLLTANGHINPQATELSEISSYQQPLQFFINNGSGIFTDQAPTLRLNRKIVGRGALTADIDRDGDQDLLITENNGGVYLFRNELNSKPNSLSVKLEGFSVDATVIAHIGNQKQFRRIRAGHSYASQSEQVMIFGLGQHSVIDTLTVIWPNGSVTQQINIDANQTLYLREK